MEKSFDTCNLPKLNSEDTENINRTIMYDEMEFLIKYLQIKKSQGSYRFTDELYQIFKREGQISNYSKVFKGRGTLPNSFYQASITVITKSDQDTTTTKNKQANK